MTYDIGDFGIPELDSVMVTKRLKNELEISLHKPKIKFKGMVQQTSYLSQYYYYHLLLSPGRCGCEFKYVNFIHNLGMDILIIHVNITME